MIMKMFQFHLRCSSIVVGNETVKSEIAVNKTDDVKETPADDSVKVEDLNSVTEEDLKNYWLSLCWSACEVYYYIQISTDAQSWCTKYKIMCNDSLLVRPSL